MKAIKRTVAALLATLMLATSTSFTLAAEEYSDAEAVVVAKVNGAGIMTGTDKGFEPSKSLTRAEAAAIIVRMKGISESAVKATAGTTLFNDVAASHWASGYVNQASNLGIVKGVSATEFAPDREVTVAEFVTMAVRALGAGQLVDSEGTWPTNYVNFANEQGILDDVNAIYTAVATRMNAATIVANTLEASMWEKTGVKSNGEITWSNTNGKTILEDTLNIERYENAIISNIDTKDRDVDYTSIAVDKLGDPIYEGTGIDVAKVVELGSIRTGIDYDFWYNKNSKEIVAIFKANDSKQNTVEFTEIVKVDSTNAKITLKVNGTDKKYSYVDNDASKSVAYINSNKAGVAVKAGTAPFAAAGNEDLFGSAIIKNDTVTTVFGEYYTNVDLVKEVKNNTIYFNSDLQFATAYNANAKSSIKYDDDKYEYVITKDGKEISFADIEEGDVVFYYIQTAANTTSGVDKYVINVLTDSVEGKVSAYKAGSYIKLDSTKYDVAAGISITTDKTITAYMNKAGKIVAYLENKDESDSDLGVVTSFRIKESSYTDGEDIFEVTLAGMDGAALETKELDVEEMAKKLSIAKATLISQLYATIDKTEVISDATLKTKALDKSIVGELVRFETKSGKYVITEFVDIADKDNNTNVISTRTGAKKLVVAPAATYDEDTMKLGDYRLTESTKVVLVSPFAYSKAKAIYSVEVETIEATDLGDGTYTCYISGINDANNKVSNVVIYLDDVSRTTNKDYAVITDVVLLTNNDDYAADVTLLFTDGTTKTLLHKSDLTSSIGAIKEVKTTDTVLDEVKAVTATTASAAAYLFNISDETIKASITGDVVKYYTVAENMIYVELTEDGEYVEGTSSEITTLAKAEKFTVPGDAVPVTVYFAKNTDTNEDEVIAIYYNEADLN